MAQKQKQKQQLLSQQLRHESGVVVCQPRPPSGSELWKLDGLAHSVLEVLFIRRHLTMFGSDQLLHPSSSQTHTQPSSQTHTQLSTQILSQASALSKCSQTQNSLGSSHSSIAFNAEISSIRAIEDSGEASITPSASIPNADVVSGYIALKMLEDNPFLWGALDSPQTTPAPIFQRLLLVLLGSYVIDAVHARQQQPQQPSQQPSQQLSQQLSQPPLDIQHGIWHLECAAYILEHGALQVHADLIDVYIELLRELRTQIYIARYMRGDAVQDCDDAFSLPLDCDVSGVSLAHIDHFHSLLDARIIEMKEVMESTGYDAVQVCSVYPFEGFTDDAAAYIAVLGKLLSYDYSPKRVRDMVRDAHRKSEQPVWAMYVSNPALIHQEQKADQASIDMLAISSGVDSDTLSDNVPDSDVTASVDVALEYKVAPNQLRHWITELLDSDSDVTPESLIQFDGKKSVIKQARKRVRQDAGDSNSRNGSGSDDEKSGVEHDRHRHRGGRRGRSRGRDLQSPTPLLPARLADLRPSLRKPLGDLSVSDGSHGVGCVRSVETIPQQRAGARVSPTKGTRRSRQREPISQEEVGAVVPIGTECDLDLVLQQLQSIQSDQREYQIDCLELNRRYKSLQRRLSRVVDMISSAQMTKRAAGAPRWVEEGDAHDDPSDTRDNADSDARDHDDGGNQCVAPPVRSSSLRRDGGSHNKAYHDVSELHRRNGSPAQVASRSRNLRESSASHIRHSRHSRHSRHVQPSSRRRSKTKRTASQQLAFEDFTGSHAALTDKETSRRSTVLESTLPWPSYGRRSSGAADIRTPKTRMESYDDPTDMDDDDDDDEEEEEEDEDDDEEEDDDEDDEEEYDEEDEEDVVIGLDGLNRPDLYSGNSRQRRAQSAGRPKERIKWKNYEVEDLDKAIGVYGRKWQRIASLLRRNGEPAFPHRDADKILRKYTRESTRRLRNGLPLGNFKYGVEKIRFSKKAARLSVGE
ncbi:hypothetical protein BASA81_009459 [Batrachochytrium salamandrivorans]|nr:hypothetical protein BASA81_009459 [Batrachochytrium salamandrivorans]